MENKKTKLTGLVFIALAVLGLIGVVWLVRYSQDTRRGAYYGGVTASILPNTRQVTVDESFQMHLNVNPVFGEDSYLITFFQTDLTFDNSLLELVSVEYDDVFGGLDANLDQINAEGVIPVSGYTMQDSSMLHQEAFNFVTLTFKALSVGTAQINQSGTAEIGCFREIEAGQTAADLDQTLELTGFTAGEVEVVGEEGEEGTELTEPEPTEPEPTEPEEPAEMSLTFKIKLGGTTYSVEGSDESKVVSNIPVQPVDVVVKNYGVKKEYKNIPVVFNEKAVGTGTVDLYGLQPGDKYAILIKGPVHLSKKFCRDKQSDHCWAGEENISLRKGDNEFDWTSLELEPGDIDRNGVVNAVDFGKLKKALGHKGENVPEDLNRNGQVNTQDTIFLLHTLSTKYEEDI